VEEVSTEGRRNPSGLDCILRGKNGKENEETFYNHFCVIGCAGNQHSRIIIFGS